MCASQGHPRSLPVTLEIGSDEARCPLTGRNELVPAAVQFPPAPPTQAGVFPKFGETSSRRFTPSAAGVSPQRQSR